MSALTRLRAALRRAPLGPRGTLPLLSRPLWLGSLGLLALNDHLLKGSGLLPGWLTGKLSDVAGMLVAPALLAALLRVRTTRGLLYAHLAVGAGFAALELSLTLSAQLDALYQLAGHRWRATKDYGDLLVLALLPLSYAWAARVARAGSREAERRLVVPRDVALAGVGLLACVATSDSEDGSSFIQPSCDFDCDMDGVEAPEDCNDFDPQISPERGNCPGGDNQERCDDGQDNDQDGAIDCQDGDCQAACAATRDACLAPATTVAQTGELVGSTLLGSWALEGHCGGSDAPEVIFRLQAPISGVLKLQPPEEHVAYARFDCEASYELVDCAKPDEQLEVELAAGEEVFVIIDAENALAAADFVIPVVFTPAGCGDGVLDPATETCDDGNGLNGDGCSSLCSVEQDVLCDALPELELGAVDTTFAGGHAYLASSCSEEGGGDAPERGFHFVAAEAGVLTVTAASPGSVGLFAQAVCPGPIVACAPHVEPGSPVDLSVPMAAGAEVFVYVEGSAGLPLDTPVSLVSAFEAN